MAPTQFLNSVLRAFRWHRRWFAAIFAVLAVLAALNVISSRSSGSVAVVTAARSITGGTKLVAADLKTSWLPESSIAEGYFGSVEALIGEEVVANIPLRGVLTGSDLLSEGAPVAPGKLALPVRFADSTTIALLQAGSRIDVLGQTGSGSEYTVVATQVRVIAVPDSGDSGMLKADSGELVLIEVEQSQAAAISAAGSSASLSFALH